MGVSVSKGRPAASPQRRALLPARRRSMDAGIAGPFSTPRPLAASPAELNAAATAWETDERWQDELVANYVSAAIAGTGIAPPSRGTLALQETAEALLGKAETQLGRPSASGVTHADQRLAEFHKASKMATDSARERLSKYRAQHNIGSCLRWVGVLPGKKLPPLIRLKNAPDTVTGWGKMPTQQGVFAPFDPELALTTDPMDAAHLLVLVAHVLRAGFLNEATRGTAGTGLQVRSIRPKSIPEIMEKVTREFAPPQFSEPKPAHVADALELRAVVKDAQELLAMWDRIAANPCFEVIMVENTFLHPEHLRDTDGKTDQSGYDRVVIHAVYSPSLPKAPGRSMTFADLASGRVGYDRLAEAGKQAAMMSPTVDASGFERAAAILGGKAYSNPTAAADGSVAGVDTDDDAADDTDGEDRLPPLRAQGRRGNLESNSSTVDHATVSAKLKGLFHAADGHLEDPDLHLNRHELRLKLDTAKLMAMVVEAGGNEALAKLDGNSDGHLTAQELLDQLDVDDDSAISLMEFVTGFYAITGLRMPPEYAMLLMLENTAPTEPNPLLSMTTTLSGLPSRQVALVCKIDLALEYYTTQAEAVRLATMVNEATDLQTLCNACTPGRLAHSGSAVHLFQQPVGR